MHRTPASLCQHIVTLRPILRVLFAGPKAPWSTCLVLCIRCLARCLPLSIISLASSVTTPVSPRRDINLALEGAGKKGVQLPAGELTAELYEQISAADGHKMDFAYMEQPIKRQKNKPGKGRGS